MISGQQSGVIKYLGNIHFQPGLWAGLELLSPVGLHDGRVDDVEYFRCKPRYGGEAGGGRRFKVFLVDMECSPHCGPWRWLNSCLYSGLYSKKTTSRHQPRLNNTPTASTNGNTGLSRTLDISVGPLSDCLIVSPDTKHPSYILHYWDIFVPQSTDQADHTC